MEQFTDQLYEIRTLTLTCWRHDLIIRIVVLVTLIWNPEKISDHIPLYLTLPFTTLNGASCAHKFNCGITSSSKISSLVASWHLRPYSIILMNVYEERIEPKVFSFFLSPKFKLGLRLTYTLMWLATNRVWALNHHFILRYCDICPCDVATRFWLLWPYACGIFRQHPWIRLILWDHKEEKIVKMYPFSLKRVCDENLTQGSWSLSSRWWLKSFSFVGFPSPRLPSSS